MKLKLEDRRSDIIAARDAWQKEYDAAQATYDSQYNEYEMARADSEMFLEEKVKTIVGRTFLNLDVSATAYGGRYGAKTYEVHIENREGALRWDWRVRLDVDGNVDKDSGSWSGLQAISDEDMDQLEESVRILRKLNNTDWKPILDRMEDIRPKYNDYITAQDPRRMEKPNFGSQLKQASIEDAIGQKVLIRGTGNETGGREGSYYIIHKQTPKQTSVTEISKYYVDKLPEGEDLWNYAQKYGVDYRISTDKFLSKISENPEIIDLR